MLDDLGYEMEVTESKLDATVTKIAKALHMTSGKHTFWILCENWFIHIL